MVLYVRVEDGAYPLSSAMLKQSLIGDKGLSFSALLMLMRKDRLGILCTNHEEDSEKSAFHSHGRRCGIHIKNTRDRIKYVDERTKIGAICALSESKGNGSIESYFHINKKSYYFHLGNEGLLRYSSSVHPLLVLRGRCFF